MEDPTRPYWLQASDIVLTLRELGQTMPELVSLSDKLEALFIETKVMRCRAIPPIKLNIDTLPQAIREKLDSFHSAANADASAVGVVAAVGADP